MYGENTMSTITLESLASAKITASASTSHRGAAARPVRYSIDTPVEERKAAVLAYTKDQIDASLPEGAVLQYTVDAEPVKQKGPEGFMSPEKEFDGKKVCIYRFTVKALFEGTNVLGVPQKNDKKTDGVCLYENAKGFSLLKDETFDGNVTWDLGGMRKAVAALLSA
jgi:hypothetical protein